MLKIGIIGGSGLENPNILQEAREVEVTTPYGKPSSPLKVGKISGVDVVLLSRHGRTHSIMPTNVPNQANIWALKQQGCTHILASTACGSLREEIKPGDFVFINQFIDRTTKRAQTFYEERKVCHIPMAEPFCSKLRLLLDQSAHELGLPCHKEGTMITIEGPRFSTKAESKMFRSWGADVINMSTVPEVVLAREAGMCYAAVAMSTDYDCWRETEEAVNIEQVLKVFHHNAEKVIKLFVHTIPKIQTWECKCQQDIKTSVIGGEEKDICLASSGQNSFEINLRGRQGDLPPTGMSPSDFLCENFEDAKQIQRKEKAEEKNKSTSNKNNEWLKSKIRTVPNWPKPGIMFRDITTLIQNPEAFNYVIQQFAEHYQHQKIDKIAGIEARGFIFGAALAYKLNLPFVLIRKKGKLPAETVSQEYALEYGTDKIEMHRDAVNAGDNVLIMDDLLATGGTMNAACQLVEKIGGKVAGVGFVIDLPELKGRDKLQEYDIFHLVEFNGE